MPLTTSDILKKLEKYRHRAKVMLYSAAVSGTTQAVVTSTVSAAAGALGAGVLTRVASDDYPVGQSAEVCALGGAVIGFGMGAVIGGVAGASGLFDGIFKKDIDYQLTAITCAIMIVLSVSAIGQVPSCLAANEVFTSGFKNSMSARDMAAVSGVGTAIVSSTFLVVMSLTLGIAFLCMNLEEKKAAANSADAENKDAVTNLPSPV